MSTVPPPRWQPTPERILCVIALLLFLGSALAFHGNLTGGDGSTLLALGLACLALVGVL